MRYHVLREAAGETVEAFLLHLAGVGPRAALKRAFAAGIVFLNGLRAARAARVSEGDVVEIRDGASCGLHPREELTVRPEPELPARLVLDSPRLFVVDKPAGQAAHPLRPDEQGTTLNALAALDPEAAAPLRPGRPLEGGLAHRLDRGTSGLLVCARSSSAWDELRELWSSRKLEKIYLAWLQGEFVERGTVELSLAHDPKSRRRMTTSVPRGERSWPAVTSFQPVHHTTETEGGATLVLIRIHTGVTHQIRATVAALGHPVLGDEIYAATRARKAADKLPLTRLEPETAAAFEHLRNPLAALRAPHPELLPARGFFLHALWLRAPALEELARGVTAPPPPHFGSQPVVDSAPRIA